MNKNFAMTVLQSGFAYAGGGLSPAFCEYDEQAAPFRTPARKKYRRARSDSAASATSLQKLPPEGLSQPLASLAVTNHSGRQDRNLPFLSSGTRRGAHIARGGNGMKSSDTPASESVTYLSALVPAES